MFDSWIFGSEIQNTHRIIIIAWASFPAPKLRQGFHSTNKQAQEKSHASKHMPILSLVGTFDRCKFAWNLDLSHQAQGNSIQINPNCLAVLNDFQHGRIFFFFIFLYDDSNYRQEKGREWNGGHWQYEQDRYEHFLLLTCLINNRCWDRVHTYS